MKGSSTFQKKIIKEAFNPETHTHTHTKAGLIPDGFPVRSGPRPALPPLQHRPIHGNTAAEHHKRAFWCLSAISNSPKIDAVVKSSLAKVFTLFAALWTFLLEIILVGGRWCPAWRTQLQLPAQEAAHTLRGEATQCSNHFGPSFQRFTGVYRCRASNFKIPPPPLKVGKDQKTPNKILCDNKLLWINWQTQ